MEVESRDHARKLSDEAFYDTEGNEKKESRQPSARIGSKLAKENDDSMTSDSCEPETLSESDSSHSSGAYSSEDDGLTEQAEAEFKLLEKDWELRLDVIEKEGFRAGVEAGQNKRLQEGFNKGYKVAAERIFKLSKCKGFVDALLGIHNGNKWINLSEEDVQSLEASIKEIDCLEAAVKAGVQAQISSIDCDKETCCGGTCKGDQDKDLQRSSPDDAQQCFRDKKASAVSNDSEESQGATPSTSCQQNKRDGKITYELAVDGQTDDFSQTSKDIDALHENVLQILKKYDILNAKETQKPSQI